MTRQRVRQAGILISFLLFPITIYYLSPYLIIQGITEGVISGSMLVFSLMFLSALFFGRLFCGWVCPAAGLQEACLAVKNKRVPGGNWIKWLIWVPWMGVITWVLLRFGFPHKLVFTYFTTYGISVAEPGAYIIYYGVLSLCVTLAFTAGKRSFCHHVCWMAPFMISGRWLRNRFQWPALHLRSEKIGCTNCLTCTRDCPMSLDVHAMVQQGRMENLECILCGTCVDGCKAGIIKFAYLNRKSESPRR